MSELASSVGKPLIGNVEELGTPVVTFSPLKNIADTYISSVLRMTREVFRSDAACEPESDAEIDESYFAISVTTSEDAESVVRMYDQWHLQLLSIAGVEAHHYRLVLNVQ